ncbi:MAG: hypothetical protein ACLVB5_15695 [Christensenellales bacterium]
MPQKGGLHAGNQLMGAASTTHPSRPHVALARTALDSGRPRRVLFLPTGNPARTSGKGWPIGETVCA